MPSAAARRMYEDQIPTFMSVFDMGSEAMDDRSTVTVVEPKLVGMETTKQPTDSIPQLRPNTFGPDSIHKHNDSTSTQNSESAESSPTTTLSCTDSSSLSDPSPSSSPDSPVNLPPLSSFPGISFGGLTSMASLNISNTTNVERPMTSPTPKRPRNMKGLSIQPPFNSMSNSQASEPASPSFIKPKIPAMKRKPSQLSLKTNSSDLGTRVTLEVPTSPTIPPIPKILEHRALKHSTSSPHMLSSLKSATFGPVGGMTIPTVLERNESGLSEFFRPSKPPGLAPIGLDSTIAEEDSPIRTQIASRAAFEFEPHHELENNEDQKTPGYPDGPIAIYSDNVYLYLEPTAEEASRFDLVINVAREVLNPFKALADAKSLAPEEDNLLLDNSPIPDTAVTAASYSTAFEFFPEEGTAETPTTPKAMPLKEPEYIHMLWDHNTDISGDLPKLCETIEERTKEGKKVLIHCQQGASRSASLIIAYGIWQNNDLSVNDAYYAAQAKSRWISPNMRLMYCLQDFQKEMSKKKATPVSGFKLKAARSPTKHRATLSADAIDIPIKEPLTAPLPNEDNSSSGDSPERSPIRTRGNSTPNRGEPISPGPSSAPSSFSWGEREDDSDPEKPGRFAFNPFLKLSPPDSGSPSLSSQTRPPPSPGFAPMSPGFPPPSLSLMKPPPSPGFGLMSPNPFSKPPPSPGFGHHRFGGAQNAGGFGLLPLALAAPPQRRGSSSSREAPPPPPERRVRIMRSFPNDAALMSPRVETMTNNPLHGHEPFAEFTGMQFVEAPPTPSEGLFSPRETMFPRDPFYPFGRPSQNEDPRSPPTLGETPIVRSIDELI